MTTFEPGDRVWVVDPGLEALRDIMRRHDGKEPAPNHHGTVDEIEDGRVYINFDDGGCAPYPAAGVRPLWASA